MLYEKLILNKIGKKLPALYYLNNVYTYEEINIAVINYTQKLSKYGLKKGDRVLIKCNNSLESLIAILTCIYLNYIFIPITYKMSEDKIEYIVIDSNVKLILYCSNSNEKIKFTDVYENKINVDFTFENWKIMPRDLSMLDDIVYIIYTSGTTKEPKGVVAPMESVLFACDGINSVLMNNENDRVFCRLPLYFDYGLYQIFLSFLNNSSLILVSNESLIQDIPRQLIKYKATALPLVPSLLNILVNTKLLNRYEYPCLRYVTTTGEVLTTDLIRETEEILPKTNLIPMYGLTECKRVSILPTQYKEKKRLGSCGLPLNGTKVWLDNAKDGIGELVVEGRNVMDGYWNDKSETEKKFRFIDGRRILYTGDMFKIDDDGFLYFKGRNKNFIKFRGHRINLLEIEDRVLKCKEILEAVAFTYKGNYGDQLKCCVYTKNNYDKEYIKKLCIEVTKEYNISDVIVLNIELPKNSNNKIDRKEIERIYGNVS